MKKIERDRSEKGIDEKGKRKGEKKGKRMVWGREREGERI